MKSLRPCTNCLPSRRGKCLNMSTRFTSQELRQLVSVLGLMKTAEMLAPSPDSSQVLSSLSSQQEADTDSVPTDTDTAKPSCLDTDSHTTMGFHLPLLWLVWPFPGVNMRLLRLPKRSRKPMMRSCTGKEISSQYHLGMQGKAFVLELSRLFRAYAEDSALESIAMKACTVMPQLDAKALSIIDGHAAQLLQCLEMRKKGDLPTLISEGRSLQLCSLNSGIDPVRSSKKRHHVPSHR